MNQVAPIETVSARRILIGKLSAKKRGVYSLTVFLDNGEVIVTSGRAPEFAACRALVARGIAGTLITRRDGEKHDSLRIDIERGAKLTVKDGPRFTKWSPFDTSKLGYTDDE